LHILSVRQYYYCPKMKTSITKYENNVSLHTHANNLLKNKKSQGGIYMHKTYKNLADLLLNCDSAQKFYNNLSLHSKLEVKEKGSHLRTENELRSLAKTISEQ